MNYTQALAYLNSFLNYEKQPPAEKRLFQLERIKNFLASLGPPQDSFKVIHIAGTKGKGSTASFTAYILKQAGFRVGLYTSPHLVDFCERIRILDRANPRRNEFEGKIPRSEVSYLLTNLKPKIDSFNAASKYGELTFFEIVTVLAFEYFKQQRIAFAVLETGMGGRLDATNACQAKVCGISPISLEHTQILGSTLGKIAREKAGIIRPNSVVISAPQDSRVEAVLRKYCKKLGAKIYFAGKDLPFEKIGSNPKESRFKLKSIFNEYLDLRIKLRGDFQIINASLAVALVDALELNLKPAVVKQGLLNAKWPGRFETLSRKPLIIADGAQNTHSAQALVEAVKKYYPKIKVVLVLGVCADKDIGGICRVLKELNPEVILTEANNPRAASAKLIQQAGKFKGAKLTASIKAALTLAKSSCQNNELILVTGSLFVVGEAICICQRR